MSYILDALRKSDQLRRRNAAPTLLPGLAGAEQAKPMPVLAYGALALVLLAAGIAIGWLRPWQSPPPNPVPVAEVKPPEPAAQPGLAPLPGAPAQAAVQTPGVEPAARATPAAPVVARPTQVPAPAVAGETQGASRPSTVATETPPAPRPPAAAMETRSARSAPVAKSAVPPAPASAAPAADQAARGSAAAAPPAVTIVMNMADLPLAIQQELPSMSISVHAYSSKPAERLVGINGRLLHEGDSVAPGLTLEQITPAGMILSYKGYIFRHGVR